MATGLAERIRNSGVYPAAYMFVMTAVCASVLVGLATSTRQRVKANERIRFERAVLQAVAAPVPGGASPLTVHRMFQERLGAPSEKTGGAYRLIGDGKTMAYALPFEGQGFWDVIKGVIGIGTDLETVVGIAFYEQKETPGLGAEISKADFTGPFAGRRLAKGAKALRLRPAGAELSGGDVHAVTGATQTCTRLERMLNAAIEAWRRQQATAREAPESVQARLGADVSRQETE